MRREEITAFARRDWDALAASKDAQWLRERHRRGLGWCLRIADDLRRQVARQRREWPSAAERAEDVAVHVRVAAALRRAGRAGRR